MLIGIEATRANKPQKTGVEWYAWHVIQELKRQTTGDGNSWILYSNAPLVNGLEMLPENWYEIRATWPLPYGWTQFRLSYELKKHPIDVLWIPGTTLPRYHQKRTVVTVHDIGFHRLPKLYKSRQLHIHEYAMKEAVKRAERIITVSEFSGREMVDVYGVDPQKIAITNCGVDHTVYRPITDAQGIDARLRRYQISSPFFVTVGRLEAKKNILTLIRAFTQFKMLRGVGDPYQLVLIGIPGFGYEEIKREIAASSAKAYIKELGYVPESDMPYILNGAEALVHPSWYEGFGIPPVQAMASGCPVLSSNSSSLPEVCGDAAVFFSPDSREELTATLMRLITEPSLKQELRTKGIAQAAKYTWQATAEKTLPVLTRW